MTPSRLDLLKTKAKLLQKAKKKSGNPVQLKTAFALIAKATGFSSWREFKAAVELGEKFRFPGSSAHWSVWYASYDEARKHLNENGGFLIPCEKHYFVCDIHYIENLGIKASDPDLKAVGHDWVHPADRESWNRLIKKIKSGN